MVATLAQSKDDARRVLATMWAIRRFEEAVDEMFARGLLYGTMHLSIGQEASATGALSFLVGNGGGGNNGAGGGGPFVP